MMKNIITSWLSLAFPSSLMMLVSTEASSFHHHDEATIINAGGAASDPPLQEEWEMLVHEGNWASLTEESQFVGNPSIHSRRLNEATNEAIMRFLASSSSSGSSSNHYSQYLQSIGTGFEYSSNAEYEQYQLAWRYLGLSIDCSVTNDQKDHHSHDDNNGEEEDRTCTRVLLYAVYVDFDYNDKLGLAQYQFYNRKTGNWMGCGQQNNNNNNKNNKYYGNNNNNKYYGNNNKYENNNNNYNQNKNKYYGNNNYNQNNNKNKYYGNNYNKNNKNYGGNYYNKANNNNNEQEEEQQAEEEEEAEEEAAVYYGVEEEAEEEEAEAEEEEAYNYYGGNRERDLGNNNNKQNQRCVAMDCHLQDSENFVLLGVFKNYNPEKWMEQLFKHEGICVWTDDEYIIAQAVRKSLPEKCTRIGYEEEGSGDKNKNSGDNDNDDGNSNRKIVGDGLYYHIKPEMGGNIGIGLYTDRRCTVEYTGSLTMDQIIEGTYDTCDNYNSYYYNTTTYTYQEYLEDCGKRTPTLLYKFHDQFNDAMNIYKHCQSCVAYNLNYDDFQCDDDAGYTNCMQCMKFKEKADSLPAFASDLLLASRMNSMLAIDINGLRYGYGGYTSGVDDGLLNGDFAYSAQLDRQLEAQYAKTAADNKLMGGYFFYGSFVALIISVLFFVKVRFIDDFTSKRKNNNDRSRPLLFESNSHGVDYFS